MGHLVEWYLGKPPNSSDEADIPELGIEVKTLPMEQRRREWLVKEPTSLTMIRFRDVAQQAWQDAYVRKKLNHILWVPYEHNYDDKRLHRFRKPFLWSPDAIDLPTMAQDYEGVRRRIRAGQAHELSESHSLILAARRKGGKGETREQPFNPSVRAPSRAWALKTGYTGVILDRFVLRAPLPRLIDSVAEVRSVAGVLPYVETRLQRFAGQSMESIATTLGATLDRSKNRNATLVRKAIGLPAKGTVEEFEKLGLRVHQLNVRPSDGVLNEAVPFPAMNLRKFAEEEWEDSEFREHIDRILFIPTYSESGKYDSPRTLGHAFLWEPTPAQLEGIESEWRLFQAMVREGKAPYVQTATRRAAQVPSERSTRYIHMRPHGQDSNDTDTDPHGVKVTRQALWLNKAFVASLVHQQAQSGPP